MMFSFKKNTKSGKDIFMVAEIGKNFIQTKEDRGVDEYLKNAKDLIDAAAEAGVDSVKFQTHHLDDEQFDIPVGSPHFTEDRVRWIKRNMEATPLHFWHEVQEHAMKRGLIFFSTPMSKKAAQKLHTLDVPLWKVASGDVTDFLLLDFLIQTGTPIIISTGMVSFSELDLVVSYLESAGANFSILYCVSKYPAPPEAFNLSTIKFLREKYPTVPIGFSDHSVGNHDVPLSAARLGACIIEKHFSFSRELWGSDHKASLTPKEMKELVSAIRSGVYLTADPDPYYGFIEKELEGATSEFRLYFRKSLVAACYIPAGSRVSISNLKAMRPLLYAKGIEAYNVPAVVGKKVKEALHRHDPIVFDNLEE